MLDLIFNSWKIKHIKVRRSKCKTNPKTDYSNGAMEIHADTRTGTGFFARLTAIK